MPIPNRKDIVQRAKDTYPRAWSRAHHDGNPERLDFNILCGRMLFDANPNFGLNGKRGGNDLSADAINWKVPGEENVIDIIGSAGSPDASVQWNITNTTGKWFNPYNFATHFDYGENPVPVPTPTPPPTPKLPPYPGDDKGNEVGAILFRDYGRAGQDPNPGMGTWFNRTIYDYLAGMPLEESIKKHRAEWCAILGIPVD
jgi:hypothetical protein